VTRATTIISEKVEDEEMGAKGRDAMSMETWRRRRRRRSRRRRRRRRR
jgi:hypothetical protein